MRKFYLKHERETSVLIGENYPCGEFGTPEVNIGIDEGVSMREIWVPVSGAIAMQRNVENIANNVANANTPGFKKDQSVFKEYLAGIEKPNEAIDLPMKEWKTKDYNRTYNSEDAFVKVDGSYTDFDQGALTPTGNPLDSAISGEGFFEIATANGVRYTRKGSFMPNKDGFLVNDTGDFVLGKASAENSKDFKARQIQFPPMSGAQKMGINPNGEIWVGDKKIGELSVVEFVDRHTLRKEGTNYFINMDEKNKKLIAEHSSVQQGFIEQSNVNAVSEMTNLINANRQFESIQRVLKTYDSMSSKGVNEISKF